jgi:hypothetical protein
MEIHGIICKVDATANIHILPISDSQKANLMRNLAGIYLQYIISQQFAMWYFIPTCFFNTRDTSRNHFHFGTEFRSLNRVEAINA